MYEDITYESILQGMLNKVPNDLDKREGSIIYNALAPAAVELQNVYIELVSILNESFADTASREYLIKRAAERGIIPEPATKAILKGEFNIDVPIGSRYSLDDLNYIVTEKISTGVYKLQCESSGRIANNHFGALIPIEYIDRLETAKLTELLIPGEDEEETETLRKRYFNSLDSRAFGGNIQDYNEKINAINGVGGVKVYPVWNGGGTVKLVIINSDYLVPSATLVNDVQTAIDPVQNQGKGLGLAPVGHAVTVVGVAETIVNIATSITYQEGWSWEAVKNYAETAIDNYFKELSKSWADNTNLIVRISQIETRFLGLPGVLDIRGTSINGAEQNLVLDENKIPKRGALVG